MDTKIVSMLAICIALFSACAKERQIDEPGLLVPKTVDQDPSLPSITINGVQLHSQAFGPKDSAIVLMLHGGPGSDHRYLLEYKKLAEAGYRVVFYDQRGQGLSQRLSAETYTSMDVFTDEVRDVIAHYRTSPKQKVFIIGDSWGGMLGAAFANRFPNSLQGLVVSEPGGFIWQDIVDYVTRSRSFSLWGETLNDATFAEQFITLPTPRKKTGEEHEILDYKLGILTAHNPITKEEPELFWRFGAVANAACFDFGQRQKPEWASNLKNFQPEALYFYSELNTAHGQAHAEKVSSAFKRVRLVKMLGEGHGMIVSKTGFPVAYPIILKYLDEQR